MVEARYNLNKNIRYAVVAFAINVVLVFLSYKLVILHDGISAVGLWSTLFAWTSMIRIGDVGMSSAALRFIAMRDLDNEAKEISAYLQTGVVTNLCLFSALGLISYSLLSLYLPSIFVAETLTEAQHVLPIMMLSFFLMNISGTLLGTLQGLHLGYVNSQLVVIGNIVQILCVLVLVPKIGLVGLAWAQVTQYSLTIVVTWFWLRRKIGIVPILPVGVSWLAFREMLSYSIKIQIANVANGLFEPASKLLIGHFGGLQTLGIYELAFKTVSLPRNAVAAGLTASLPSMASLYSTDKHQAEFLYKKSLRYLLSTGVIVLLCVVALAPVVSIVWIGTYSPAYWLSVAVIAVGFLFNLAGAPAYNLGVASGVMQYNITTSFLSLILLLVLGYLLNSAFGSFGTVLAVAACLSVSGLLIMFLNEHHLFPQEEECR